MVHVTVELEPILLHAEIQAPMYDAKLLDNDWHTWYRLFSVWVNNTEMYSLKKKMQLVNTVVLC